MNNCKVMRQCDEYVCVTHGTRWDVNEECPCEERENDVNGSTSQTAAVWADKIL